MSIPLPPLPDNLPCVQELRARDQEIVRCVLEAAAKLNWVDMMREDQLVTWGDAGTLGYRVVEALRALEFTHHE